MTTISSEEWRKVERVIANEATCRQLLAEFIVGGARISRPIETLSHDECKNAIRAALAELERLENLC